MNSRKPQKSRPPLWSPSSMTWAMISRFVAMSRETTCVNIEQSSSKQRSPLASSSASRNRSRNCFTSTPVRPRSCRSRRAWMTMLRSVSSWIFATSSMNWSKPHMEPFSTWDSLITFAMKVCMRRSLLLSGKISKKSCRMALPESGPPPFRILKYMWNRSTSPSVKPPSLAMASWTLLLYVSSRRLNPWKSMCTFLPPASSTRSRISSRVGS
mmetsp:Transcript_18031/g.54329  ORF Transcript_18031/g.54329 Transcript_18031/m.54329 type:complete len:212 (-) Transcript_18031:2236-2871(-)